MTSTDPPKARPDGSHSVVRQWGLHHTSYDLDHMGEVISICGTSQRPERQSMISKFKFRRAVGEWPIYDDMERVNCPKAGEDGHRQCGWCEEHNKPRMMCGCSVVLKGK